MFFRINILWRILFYLFTYYVLVKTIYEKATASPTDRTQQTEQLYTYTMHSNKKSIFLPLNIKHILRKIVNMVTNQL